MGAMADTLSGCRGTRSVVEGVAAKNVISASQAKLTKFRQFPRSQTILQRQQDSEAAVTINARFTFLLVFIHYSRM
jgi:hypothetical protein